MVREKMEKMAETRIRSKKEVGVKVNKGLAEKIIRDQEKAKLKAERKNKNKGAVDSMDVDEEAEETSSKPTILSDPRFAQVFEDPAFAIDENSREFALLNPSSVARGPRGKTAVEDEEDESDRFSDDESEGSDEDSDDGASSDSSAEGGTSCSTFILFSYFF